MIAELICAGLCCANLNKTPAPTGLPKYILEENADRVCRVNDDFYTISEEDFNLMVRVVMSESGGQPMECKEAVATTILNRCFSPNHPNNIKDNVDSAYSTSDNGAPNDECYMAVTNAIKWYGTEEQVIPWCCYYFRGGHYHSWAQDYRKIGDLYFSVPSDACLE